MIVHILAQGRVWCGQLSGFPSSWPKGHTWVDSNRDANCEKCIENRRMAMMKDALEQAPTWHYGAKECDRKKLEEFMKEYCLWYNGVRNHLA